MRCILFGAVIFSSFSAVAAAQQQIVFERGTAIWIANSDGSNARKVTEGSGPNLSSDGKRIAFHTNSSSETDLVRRIAVVDVATKKVMVFKKEIPSDNCQHAVWASNGTQILFSIWSESDWHLGLINADGSGFRYFKKAVPKGNSYWSTCWAPDGKSIYAQDLRNLYQFGLNGTEMKKWSLDSLLPHGSMNSGSHIAVSPEGKTLLIDVDMDEEEANMPDWDGPPPSLWTLEIASQKATRLSPKGGLAWHGCWLDSKEILFTSQAAKEKEPTIYKMVLAEKNRTPVLKNANNPNVSRLTSN